jgi:alanine dehydrogenase
VDRRPGEFEGIRLSLLSGDGFLSGMRIFGNPPHTRAFMLFDGETRAMLALLDYGVLNSLRVGATAGVAARHLARRGATCVGLLGSGWQATPQVYALLGALPGIQLIQVYSPTPAHRESFAANVAEKLGVQVKACSTAADALRGADIVDLCAPGHFDVREPLFETDWIKPGALVISMAANQYPPELRERARLVADIADGDSLAGREAMSLGQVIGDQADPRRGPGDTVIYHLEGGTVQDLFVATWAYNWALAHNLGQPFNLSA